MDASWDLVPIKHYYSSHRYPTKSAYRAGHSTEPVFLRVVNDILSALDNDISVLLLLDLSVAFDTIDHQIFLARLYSLFGIQSTAL